MKAIIILMVMIIMPHEQNYLVNTTWTYKIADGCIDTLKFKPNHQLYEYDCELNYTLKGSYKLSKDTLFIIVNDDSHSEDGGKTIRFRTKYLIKSNALYTISNGEMIKGIWKDKMVNSSKPGYKKII